MIGTEKQIAYADSVKSISETLITEFRDRIEMSLSDLIEMQADEPTDRLARRIDAAKAALHYNSEIDMSDAATVIDVYKGGVSAAVYPMICRDHAINGAIPARSIGRYISDVFC